MTLKIIHYCWFGKKPIPEKEKACIDTWKTFFPDYEIKEWNDSNFDFKSCPYAQEAYEAGNFAFVSDYARAKVLYEEGGIYLDTDVEVIKSLDDFLSNELFFGYDQRSKVASGLII